MGKRNLVIVCLCIVCMSAGYILTGCGSKASPEEVKVVLWHYFNDSQKADLDRLIQEYNDTQGAQKNIVVEALSQGSVNDLADKMELALNSSTNEVDTADMFLGYRDIVVKLLKEKPGSLVDYRSYMTEEELSHYRDSYLKEGEFGEALYILPVAKSTELLMMNENRLEEFFAACPGFGTQDLKTWEGLERAAQAYYEWTDSMTPDAPNDGQAFIGMDVPANYFITQCNALGSEIYRYGEDGSVIFELDESAIGKLFDAYYIPFTKGYYGAYGKYRSDDLRQSLLAGYIGSSSSISYFPDAAAGPDGEEQPIRLGVYTYPYFEEGSKVAVQQGAGAAVVAGDEKKAAACVDFLKWLSREKGLEYASALSYMPATKEGFDGIKALHIEDGKIKQGLEAGMQQSAEYRMVYGFDFEKGLEVRTGLSDFMREFGNDGQKEFGGYLEQGMTMEEAADAMDYDGKRTEFYQGIVAIFE